MTISNGAILILSQVLSAKGWTDNKRDMRLSGAILVQSEDVEEAAAKLARQAQMIDRNTPDGLAEFYKLDDAYKAWLKEPSTFDRDFSDAEHNACKKAVEFYITSKGAASRYVSELQDLFKLTE